MAIDLYDKTELTPGHVVEIARTVEQNDTAGKEFDQSRELAWDDEGLVHVVIKNMFDPASV